MKSEAKDLLGAWQLVSWSLVYADGRPAEGTVPVWGNVRLDRLLREIRG